MDASCKVATSSRKFRSGHAELNLSKSSNEYHNQCKPTFIHLVKLLGSETKAQAISLWLTEIVTYFRNGECNCLNLESLHLHPAQIAGRCQILQRGIKAFVMSTKWHYKGSCVVRNRPGNVLLFLLNSVDHLPYIYRGIAEY